jgi:hypothetical protein
LFADPGGRTDEVREEIKRTNQEYFEHVARLSIEKNKHGGLRLLVQYEDDEIEKLENELRPRVGIFSKVAADKDFDWNPHHFDIRRLVQRSVNDYLVIEDHVFQTIRKTKGTKETQYLHLRSAVIAATYRGWLSDLFDYGEGCETEQRDKIKEKLAQLRSGLAAGKR